MFPCSLKQRSCSLVPFDIFPLFPCSPKPLGDPPKSLPVEVKENFAIVNSKYGSLAEASTHFHVEITSYKNEIY